MLLYKSPAPLNIYINCIFLPVLDVVHAQKGHISKLFRSACVKKRARSGPGTVTVNSDFNSAARAMKVLRYFPFSASNAVIVQSPVLYLALTAGQLTSMDHFNSLLSTDANDPSHHQAPQQQWPPTPPCTLFVRPSRTQLCHVSVPSGQCHVKRQKGLRYVYSLHCQSW